MGACIYNRAAFTMSKTPDTQFAAPCLGQHNEYVLKKVLQLSDEEIANLILDGVITTNDDLPAV